MQAYRRPVCLARLEAQMVLQNRAKLVTFLLASSSPQIVSISLVLFPFVPAHAIVFGDVQVTTGHRQKGLGHHFGDS